jgi:hypothetical protein
MDSVSAPFRIASGEQVATLTVNRLPGRTDYLELERERIVLEEEGTYVFDIERGALPRALKLEPREGLFSFDSPGGNHGRLRPQGHVGRIQLALKTSTGLCKLTLDVRPKKLEETTEYRQMLEDIAETATEALLQGFAPPAVALTPESERDPELLYQQFAFLHARLMTSGEHDLALVLNRPQTAWIDSEEARLAGTPLPSGSRNVRALTRSGPRTAARPGASVPSIPRQVRAMRTAETLDTEANRFVAFALVRWRELAQRVHDSLTARATQSGPVSRGIDAAEEVIELLDRTLGAPMFRDIGRLHSFPSGNQVLQKRAGYRELLRTFALTETGARLALSWDIDDVFGASQRNTAALYEYWVFLQLAKSLGRVCQDDRSALTLQPASDGMSMTFRRGKASRVVWTTTVRNRQLTLELYFGRRFQPSGRPDASWTEAMHPDCSVRIRPTDMSRQVSGDDLAIWLHFDAKYRVDYRKRKVNDDTTLVPDDSLSARVARSKRDDIVKMHAYRDAIRRSAGAYVLYPGDAEDVPFTEYHEILPGLGAFALRPRRNQPVGTERLDAFLGEVLDHVADSASQHERSRYWQTIIHRPSPLERRADRGLPGLDQPPADALVLMGFVRSTAHRKWIERTGLYNLRAGNRRGAIGPEAEILRASHLLLYGPGVVTTLWTRRGAWFVQTREDLLRLGYPSPGGPIYLCCPVERNGEEPEWLASLDLGSGDLKASEPGAPFATTWVDLLRATA